MAAGHSDSGGSMDISEHRKTWEGFVAFVKYSSAGILLVMFLLFLFRAHG